MIKNCIFALKMCWSINKKIIVYKVLNIVLSLVTTFFPILLTSKIINAIVGNVAFEQMLSKIILSIIIIYLCKILRQLLESEITKEEILFEKKFKSMFSMVVMNLEYSKLEVSSTQDMIELANNGEQLSSYIEKVFQLISNIVTIISCVAIMLNVGLIVAIVSVIPCVLRSVMGHFNYKASIRYFGDLSKLWRKQYYIEGYARDIAGAKEVRVNYLQEWLLEKLDKTIKSQLKIGVKNRIRSFISDVIVNFAIAIQIFVVYIFVALLVRDQQILIGEFTFYVSSIFIFSDSMEKLIDVAEELYKKNIFTTPLKNIMESSDKNSKETADDNAFEFDSNTPISIKFENVCFKYPNSENEVLKNINFTVNQDEKMIIVGRNGSGKTTIIKLLCRFYKPTSGTIYVNDIDINTIPYPEYIKLLGTVFQDFSHICASLKENIICAETYEEEKFLDSLERAGFMERFKTLEKGENTTIFKYLDNSGVELSGGESQKLAMAKLLYRDSQVFILDEPTAALDPISEYNLFKNFNEISNNHTTIFISHRLSSVKFCDRILVVKEGEIIEHGKFEDLMEKAGVFRSLYLAQADYYKSGSATVN